MKSNVACFLFKRGGGIVFETIIGNLLCNDVFKKKVVYFYVPLIFAYNL